VGVVQPRTRAVVKFRAVWAAQAGLEAVLEYRAIRGFDDDNMFHRRCGLLPAFSSWRRHVERA